MALASFGSYRLVIKNLDLKFSMMNGFGRGKLACATRFGINQDHATDGLWTRLDVTRGRRNLGAYCGTCRRNVVMVIEVQGNGNIGDNGAMVGMILRLALACAGSEWYCKGAPA